MTEPEKDVAAMEDARQKLATELVLLTALKDKVVGEIEARRAEVAKWSGGSAVTVEIPNPDTPSRPVKVGTVRADGGQGVARIADLEAWLDWNRRHMPHNVVQQAEGRTAWALDAKSRAALLDAFTAAAVNRFVDRPATMLGVLEAAGYTLTPVQVVPARTVVMPAWEAETLKLTQQAGAPVCPGGEIPDGIEFVPPASGSKPVVVVGKDESVRARFVAEQRHRLTEITGNIMPGGDAP